MLRNKKILVILFALISLFATMITASAASPDAKTELIAELDKFEAADSALYTPSSYEVWQNAYNIGIIVNNTPRVSENEIQTALSLLKGAYETLKLRSDKSPLSEKLAEIALIDLSIYTPQTVDNLNAAVEAARLLISDLNATEADVNSAVAGLDAKIGMLWKIADSSALLSAITEARAIDPALYTDASTSALLAEIAEAEKMIADKNSAQSAIDGAKAKIENAVSGLVAKGNTSALDALIEEIRWMDMIYTAETAEPLIEKCKETLVFLESNHSQSEIDAVRSEILSLKSNLVVNAKKSELQSFLNTMMAASTSDFTDAELNRFNAACTVAKEILSDVDATDAKIDYAIDNLQKAYEHEDGGLGVFGWILLILGLICGILLIIAGGCALDSCDEDWWDYTQLVVGIVLTIAFIILMIICGTL